MHDVVLVGLGGRGFPVTGAASSLMSHIVSDIPRMCMRRLTLLLHHSHRNGQSFAIHTVCNVLYILNVLYVNINVLYVNENVMIGCWSHSLWKVIDQVLSTLMIVGLDGNLEDVQCF